MLGAFASGWNIIVRKKTLDDNQGNLRQVMNFPGTGPFRHVSRKDKEVWIMEKNPNYWNKGLPYLDGSRSTTCRRSRPSWARRSCPARSTTRGILDPGLLAQGQGDAGRHRARSTRPSSRRSGST